MPYTSTNDNHRHTWKKGAKYTSYHVYHRHKIAGKVALRSARHTHRLLGK